MPVPFAGTSSAGSGCHLKPPGSVGWLGSSGLPLHVVPPAAMPGHSSTVVFAPRVIHASIIEMIDSGSSSPPLGIERPGPAPRSLRMRKLLAGSPGLTRRRPWFLASGNVDGWPTRFAYEVSSLSRTRPPWRATAEWHEGRAQLVVKISWTFRKGFSVVPLPTVVLIFTGTMAHAAWAVQASAACGNPVQAV